VFAEEIYSCEKTFERLFLGALFGTQAPYFIAGWRSDFKDQVWEAHHATRRAKKKLKKRSIVSLRMFYWKFMSIIYECYLHFFSLLFFPALTLRFHCLLVGARYHSTHKRMRTQEPWCILWIMHDGIHYNSRWRSTKIPGFDKPGNTLHREREQETKAVLSVPLRKNFAPIDSRV
jgi:hypothetical protein